MSIEIKKGFKDLKITVANTGYIGFSLATFFMVKN